MTSYQKLKKKNKELLDELLIIAKDKNSIESQTIINRYKMHMAMEYALWYGDMYEKQVTNGIQHHIAL